MSTPGESAADGRSGAGSGESSAVVSASSAGKDKSGKDKAGKQGPFARFALFLRQVVAELRKVIWPTRSELVNYTIVVIVFVVIMAAILALYDFVFARLVFWVFGD